MQQPHLFGLLVEPEELYPHIHDARLIILDLSRESVFEQLHLPHAIAVQPKELVEVNELTLGLLPHVEKLQQLFDRLGITVQHHVIAYDDEGGGWAGRLIWNLHCAGFDQVSLLNGGIHGWLGASLPISTETTEPQKAHPAYQVDLVHQNDIRIEYNELKSSVDDQSVQLWDCRTEAEYTGLRLTARRGGHISGAKRYEWSTAINREDHLKLHQLNRIQQQLQRVGFDLTKPVVVYCQSHHRSGLAYIVGRLLNWNVRAYDGAWSEWGNRLDSTVVNGEKPF